MTLQQADFPTLTANLAVGSGMVVVTVLVHFWGLMLLTYVLRGGATHVRPHENPTRASVLILMSVLGIFAVHTVEIWLYAGLYLVLGELHVFEQALYFSTTAFAAIGFGDVVLSPHWRLLSAIEGANGVILIAWSTAFLLATTRRLNLLEHDWLERRD